MKTVTKELGQMLENAERIKSDDHVEVGLEIGETIRQGDLYVTRVRVLPIGKERKSRQLAIGDTQGSRHILEGDIEQFIDPSSPDDVRKIIAHDCKGIDLRDYQIGPAFRTSEQVRITHPEHGDRTLTEPGCYQVTYQRALDSDMQERREMD